MKSFGFRETVYKNVLVNEVFKKKDCELVLFSRSVSLIRRIHRV